MLSNSFCWPWIPHVGTGLFHPLLCSVQVKCLKVYLEIFSCSGPMVRPRTMRNSFVLRFECSHAHLQFEGHFFMSFLCWEIHVWVAEAALLKCVCIVINKYINGLFIALLGHFKICSGKPFNSIKSTFVTR